FRQSSSAATKHCSAVFSSAESSKASEYKRSMSSANTLLKSFPVAYSVARSLTVSSLKLHISLRSNLRRFDVRLIFFLFSFVLFVTFVVRGLLSLAASRLFLVVRFG